MIYTIIIRNPILGHEVMRIETDDEGLAIIAATFPVTPPAPYALNGELCHR